MPPANPNPDRARRATGSEADVPPTAPVPRPAPAQAPAPAPVEAAQSAILPGTTAVAPAAAPAGAARTATGGGIFGLMPVRATGLTESSAARKRTAAAVRDDPAWICVKIVDEEDIKAPRWQCLGCHEYKTGTATRVQQHLLGDGGMKACSQAHADASWRAAFERVRASAADKRSKKSHKATVAAVNAAASSSSTPAPELPKGQTTINFDVRALADHSHSSFPVAFHLIPCCFVSCRGTIAAHFADFESR